VARRAGGVPLEQLLGWACFDGLRVVVTPGVFVPRRRSELLVEVVAGAAVQWQLDGLRAGERPTATGLPTPRVLDLCCGSGAIGAAVAARVRRGGGEAEVWAADVDPVAVACARHNLPPDRVLEGDLYDTLPVDLRGSFDVVAVNAPYVPTDAIATMPPEARDHEPRAALDGGTDGVDLHRRVAAGARDWLRPGGTLVVETSRRQAPLTLAALADAGLAGRVVTDDERDATAVVGTAP
jgi:release factor glutamine methyltransferase